MNYRHGFHAGNFADCMKHAVLIWLLRALARKPAPFAVLDTHAGAGAHALDGPEARRGGEAQGGILRLRETRPPALADWLALSGAAATYAGSPALAAALLRDRDRLIACELEPTAHAALRRRFRDDRRVSVHRRDGWQALRALLPPAERRGLVLIDPPYEAPDELSRALDALRAGQARFATGVFVLWYPIKHRAPVRALHDAVRAGGPADAVAAELLLRPDTDPGRLNGCGLLVINPPWRFEAEIPPLLEALRDALHDALPGAPGDARADPGAPVATVTRLSPERLPPGATAG